MNNKSIIASCVLCVIAAASCWAHAKLLTSMPADHATLSEGPKSLTLQFNEAAKLAVLKITTGGKEIAVPLDQGGKASQTFSIPLPVLGVGKYVVQWTAIAADDGHMTKGVFDFTIAG